MPAIGERVRVLFDPESPSKGCILGSYYADTRLPPYGDENKAYIIFEDNTHIEYDKRLHTLKISIPEGGEKSIDIFSESPICIETNADLSVQSAKDINIESAQNVNVRASQNINIESNANISIISAGNMDLKSRGSMSIESFGDMTLKGATINLN